MKLVKELYKECPAAFGPKWAVSPERIMKLRKYSGGWSLDGSVHLDTSSLDSQFRIFPRTKGQPRTGIRMINCFCNMTVDSLDACSLDWIIQLDPQSYGHFDDMEMKHVTWCDDRTCATTFEMSQNRALREAGQKVKSGEAVLRKNFEIEASSCRRAPR